MLNRAGKMITSSQITEARKMGKKAYYKTYEDAKHVADTYYDDSGYCAVLAVALATDNSVGKAYHALREQGRQHAKGSHLHMILNATDALDHRMVALEGLVKCTVSTIARQLPPTGKFMCLIKGHIFCVRDGVVLDWSEGRRHHIKAVWQVIERK